MPIEIVTGDLFDNSFQAQALANGCTCQGARGIARDFRQRYPAMYEEYRRLSQSAEPNFSPGDAWLWDREGKPFVFNLVLQYHREKVNREVLKKALQSMKTKADAARITSVAIPRLSTGCRGLWWRQVRSVIHEAFRDWAGTVYIYEKYTLREEPSKKHLFDLGFGFVLLLATLGLTGILLLWYAATEIHHESLLPALAHEIGMAFVVAVGLAGTVEWFLRKRSQVEHAEYTDELEELHKAHKKELEKDVFYALFGTAIEEDIIKELYRVIFKHKFIRKNLQLQYYFQPIPGQPGFLRMRQEVSFEIHNISGMRANYKFKPYADHLLEKDGQEQPIKSFKVSQGREVLADLDDGRLNLQVQPGPKARHVICHEGKETIDISVAPKTPAYVNYVVEMRMRRTDSHGWVTMHAADRLDVIVRLHESLADLRFWLDAAHSRSPEVLPCDSNTHKWRLQVAILPYQGIQLQWYPGQSLSAGLEVRGTTVHTEIPNDMSPLGEGKEREGVREVSIPVQPPPQEQETTAAGTQPQERTDVLPSRISPSTGADHGTENEAM